MTAARYTGDLTREQREAGLVIRTARKPWTCAHFTIAGPGVDYRGRPFRVVCETPIRPGDRYLEYLGESAAYESGFRYCAEHALAEWGVELDTR